MRAAVAVVLQEPYLFQATIAENILVWPSLATQEEVEAAARAAWRARSLSSGCPTATILMLGERGATLSGGERQRLSIARALLKDAPILVMDEPTSALDTETERQLVDSLKRLRAGKTTIIIAHRLSTVRYADKIAVIQAGRLVEEGTHGELLSQSGLYARLYDLLAGRANAEFGVRNAE